MGQCQVRQLLINKISQKQPKSFGQIKSEINELNRTYARSNTRTPSFSSPTPLTALSPFLYIFFVELEVSLDSSGRRRRRRIQRVKGIESGVKWRESSFSLVLFFVFFGKSDPPSNWVVVRCVHVWTCLCMIWHALQHLLAANLLLQWSLKWYERRNWEGNRIVEPTRSDKVVGAHLWTGF